MKKKIYELLLLSPNLTGREIAKKIGEERSAVNLFLSQNHDSFWGCKPKPPKIPIRLKMTVLDAIRPKF
jgi:hypothetical protein